MKKAKTCCFILSLVIFAAIGCGTVRRGEPMTAVREWKDPAVQRGEVQFAKNCHQCHPGGEGGLGPGLNDKPAPVWLMKTQVRLGLGRMPGFNDEQISSEQLDDLMAYVIAVRKER
jgi:mono/diheme cytochrome c family protein